VLPGSPAAHCHHVTGECRCPAGWTGADCRQSCPPGSYGLDCNQRCDCKSTDAECDPVSGTCRCPPGLTGRKCERACPEGLFGQDCARQCACSLGGASIGCDPISGECKWVCLFWNTFIFEMKQCFQMFGWLCWSTMSAQVSIWYVWPIMCKPMRLLEWCRLRPCHRNLSVFGRLDRTKMPRKLVA